MNPQASPLCVLLACFKGSGGASTARRSLDDALGPGTDILDEVVLRVDSQRRTSVHDPRRTLAGYLDGGLSGLVEKGLLTGVGWALFGAVAGALYGLWAGRAVSARRLRRLGPIAPPDSTGVLAWTEEDMSPDALAEWAEGNNGLLAVRFVPVDRGAVLRLGGAAT